MHFATLWEAIADEIGDREAVVAGGVRRSWREYENRAARLAALLADAGLGRDSKVGLYLWNSSEYMEAQFAALKLRGVPININYRYLDDELLYLLENSDAEALFFHSSLGERVARVKERAKKVRLWVEVDDGGEKLPGTAGYEQAIAAHDPAPRITRSPDDTYMFYTGGTTGMPKGVMYDMGGMLQAFIASSFPIYGLGMPSIDEVPGVAAKAWAEGANLVSIPACPLMHSVKFIVSSGVMWTSEIKQQLLEWNDFVLIDAMGSTEGSMGVQITARGNIGETAKFAMAPTTKVFTEDGREVQPGSGETGMVAAGGNVPTGYYKDARKSAATFRTIEGVRYSFPGDWARVEADGSLTLLGRGSNCINSAGEKIYPEEVEEAVKQHPDVVDCLVVGLPDEKFGQRVVGVASLRPGGAADSEALREFTRGKLAGYKTPKQLFIVPEVRRAPNGKADYQWARETAEQAAS